MSELEKGSPEAKAVIAARWYYIYKIILAVGWFSALDILLVMYR